MRCSNKLLSAVPTAWKRACLATPSKKRLLEETQAKKLVVHWAQDCPCSPPQSAPFCDMLENLAHRIYQPLLWNESQLFADLLTHPTDAPRYHLALRRRWHHTVYANPCLRYGRTGLSAWLLSLCLALSILKVEQWKNDCYQAKPIS